MPSDLRIQKVSNLLKEEIAKIIERDFDFPKNSLVTVTSIEISVDNYYAKVFISIISPHPARVLEILQKNVYIIQQMLNRSVRMRPVPKITFAIDRKELRRESVERSLSHLKQNKEL